MGLAGVEMNMVIIFGMLFEARPHTLSPMLTFGARAVRLQATPTIYRADTNPTWESTKHPGTSICVGSSRLNAQQKSNPATRPL